MPVGHEAVPLTQPDQALSRAIRAAQVAEENRGRNVLILDVRPMTAIFDYFVVVTGASRRQLHAISDEIDDAFRALGDRRLGIEGVAESRWILLDYGDVVIHLFDEETRSYYALEELWSQAQRVPFESTLAAPKGGT